MGKFQGVMSPITPKGSRVTSTSTSLRTDAMISPEKRRGLAREELEQLARAHRFADGLGQRLALFAGQKAPEFVLAGEDCASDRIQKVRPNLGRAVCPCIKGVGRAVDGPSNIGLLGLSVEPDHVVRVGRIEIFDHAVARGPDPGNQVLFH